MNNTRRKQLEKLSERIEQIKEEISLILEEEQEAYENMPESFQDGERGEKAQSAIDNLESIDGSLEEAIEYINEAIQ